MSKFWVLTLAILSACPASANNVVAELIGDNLKDKPSSLAICKKGPFQYVRVKEEIDEDDLDQVIFTVRLASTEKVAADFGAPQEHPDLLVSAVEDVNSDGLRDVLFYHGGCGSDSSCQYSFLANCGQGKYKMLFDFNGNAVPYINSPSILSKTTTVDGVKWKNLGSIVRNNDTSIGCEPEPGIFAFEQTHSFDGKSYVVSKAESARLTKERDAEIARIKEVCTKFAEEERLKKSKK